MKYGIINAETNICENVTVIEANSQWSAPDGYYIKALVENAGIGWSFVDGKWNEPFAEPTPDA